MDTVFDLLLGNTLTRLVFFPAVACLPLLFFPRTAVRAAKVYALAASLIEVVFGVLLLAAHLGTDGSFPIFHDGNGHLVWISSFNIRYDLAMDGISSFSYADMLRLHFPLSQQLWLFAAFALTFAIKVPMFPFHTWLPDAHVEAPTGGSVILAGILLKLGTYGFLRFALPLFPQASRAAQPLLVALAVIGILYGALVAWVQTDMKKLVAYSSIAHLGFVMRGLLAFDLIAWQGALLQMVNHGLSTGALFLLVGFLYDRRHTKKFADFGGLAKVIPL